jgi:hypothetical protein
MHYISIIKLDSVSLRLEENNAVRDKKIYNVKEHYRCGINLSLDCGVLRCVAV